MKLKEIASKINAHLKRFEADPAINVRNTVGAIAFYRANSRVAGRYIAVTYISYQYTNNLSKADALEYLAWLDAGNVGRHHTALSFNTRMRKQNGV